MSPDPLGDLDVVDDDVLRLMFLCCHPSLTVDAQVALVLRLVGGLTTDEIARAFLVPEPTMGQRLSRAKRKIRDAHISFRLPQADELDTRVDGVLGALYLLFNEGHTASGGDELSRVDLADEAIRLTRPVVELLPDHDEARGLLALMLLTHARAPARVGADGMIVRLGEQDRSTWDRTLVTEGHRLVRECIIRNQPGPLQILAAIAAVHASAPTAAQTDWSQIVTLYDQLLLVRPNDDIARLNRAIALMERSGAAAALAEFDDLALEHYHLFHAARAEALERADRPAEAGEALRRAIALTTNGVERSHLERQRTNLPDPSS